MLKELLAEEEPTRCVPDSQQDQEDGIIKQELSQPLEQQSGSQTDSENQGSQDQNVFTENPLEEIITKFFPQEVENFLPNEVDSLHQKLDLPAEKNNIEEALSNNSDTDFDKTDIENDNSQVLKFRKSNKKLPQIQRGKFSLPDSSDSDSEGGNFNKNKRTKKPLNSRNNDYINTLAPPVTKFTLDQSIQGESDCDETQDNNEESFISSYENHLREQLENSDVSDTQESSIKAQKYKTSEPKRSKTKPINKTNEEEYYDSPSSPSMLDSHELEDNFSDTEPTTEVPVSKKQAKFRTDSGNLELKNKTSKKLRAKGASAKSLPRSLDSDAETDVEPNEPECIISEETVGQGVEVRAVKKHSRRKARERLLSAVREEIPHSTESEDSNLLNSFQFLRTSFSQNESPTCFCGRQTEPSFWIFKIEGHEEELNICYDCLLVIQSAASNDMCHMMELSKRFHRFGITVKCPGLMPNSTDLKFKIIETRSKWAQDLEERPMGLKLIRDVIKKRLFIIVQSNPSNCFILFFSLGTQVLKQGFQNQF